MMMQLGADGVFVGSGIFKSGNPAERAAAIVQATTFHDDPDVLAKSRAVSARRWSASTSNSCRSRTGSPSAAGRYSAMGRGTRVARRSAQGTVSR